MMRVKGPKDSRNTHFGCAGCLNTGQFSNRVMIELDKLGVGKCYCLADVDADLFWVCRKRKDCKYDFD